MLIGYIKGYDICNVTKRILERDEMFAEIIQTEPKVKEYVKEAIENKETLYQVLGLKQKDTLKIIYIYKRDNGEMILDRKIISKDVEDEIIKKFDEIMKMEEKEGDEENSNMSILAIPVFMCFGVMFGVVYNQISIGLSIGFLIGLIVMTISNLFKSQKNK